MRIINRVGLEAEFILKNSKGEIVLPSKYGFSTDDFILIGEFRSKAGETRGETIGNYFNALSNVIRQANKSKLSIVWDTTTISPKLKSDTLELMGTKHVARPMNLYKTDLFTYSDDTVVDGKITECKISAGMHVHFSKEAFHTHTEETRVCIDSTFILSHTAIRRLVRQCDHVLLPQYKSPSVLKYRMPGYYELKPWGFEYRSLPMSSLFATLAHVEYIVDYAFLLLEKLDK